MALGIYTKPNPDYLLDTDKPLSVTFDVKTGGAYDVLLYLRNDDLTKWYDGITIVPVDVSGGWFVDGSNGYSWKLSRTSKEPVPEEWELITPGNTISFSAIGSTSMADMATYVQFWLRVEVPRRQPVHSNTTVKLQLSATEHLVGY